MKYVFTFNEINRGRVEIEACHKPNSDEIINDIFDGKADYSNTDFTDFCLVETTETSDATQGNGAGV
jgi:hypothetical protein